MPQSKDKCIVRDEESILIDKDLVSTDYPSLTVSLGRLAHDLLGIGDENLVILIGIIARKYDATHRFPLTTELRVREQQKD